MSKNKKEKIKTSSPPPNCLEYPAPGNSGGSFPIDPVNHPPHYNFAGIECIDAIRAALGAEPFRDYMMGNVMKYCWRYKYKNGIEDLRKARWYLDKTIKELEREHIERD